MNDMKVYAICFTPGGEVTLGKILDGMSVWRPEVPCAMPYALGKWREVMPDLAGDPACAVPNAPGSYGEKGFLPDPRIRTWQRKLSEWVFYAIQDADAFLFVGAVGIAVRAIAPYIIHKTTDPALVVVDEKGQFVIPVLSGHIGGANALALQIAEDLGAQPVLTTATDVRGLFAVDVFAKENDLWISDMKQAKEISAALLRGERVGFYSDFPVERDLPAELFEVGESCGKISRSGSRDAITAAGQRTSETDEAEISCGIVVSAYEKQIFGKQLLLIPRCLTVGIGCRRGTPKEKILTAVQEVFVSAGLSLQAIGKVASIDLKKDEEGLIAAALEFDVPFETFSAEALAAVEGEFLESSFVQGVTGVDNVCERAAVLAGGKNGSSCGEPASDAESGSGGELIVRKTAKDGVTVAVAMAISKLCQPRTP